MEMHRKCKATQSTAGVHGSSKLKNVLERCLPFSVNFRSSGKKGQRYWVFSSLIEDFLSHKVALQFLSQPRINFIQHTKDELNNRPHFPSSLSRFKNHLFLTPRNKDHFNHSLAGFWPHWQKGEDNLIFFILSLLQTLNLVKQVDIFEPRFWATKVSVDPRSEGSFFFFFEFVRQVMRQCLKNWALFWYCGDFLPYGTELLGYEAWSVG
jgi:hypothetical protein